MMFRRLRLLFAILLPWALPAGAEEPVSVVVSVVPQATFVSRIGGEHVEVQALVQPGQSPHAYEPTGRQIAAFADADLYVRIGVGFEDAWLPRLLAANPALRVLDAREGVTMLGHGDEGQPQAEGDGETRDPIAADHTDHADHDHGDVDPHVWTSPRRVKIIGARIRDALSELAPSRAADFDSNYGRFAADLDALDVAISARLAGLENRTFMVYHPAWGYFADDYGLEQVAIERAGKEPGARALSELVEQARRQRIRTVFVEPQFNPASAEQLAREIGGEVVVIDPLASNYFANMMAVAERIATAGAP
jgi:zinc transport system substrate-binding protein